MSQIITSSNLEEVVNTNKNIKDEVDSLIDNFNFRYNTSGISNKEKLAFKILKDNHLIQVPIADEYWGGAVFAKNGLKLPIINTAQPRVYQYFVAWHEIYHIIYDTNLSIEMHNIPIDMELNERKANYFAASVLFGNVYEYYYSLEDEDFVDKIIRCIDLYKAPYKAILIHLFEKAEAIYHDIKLKKLILDSFDNKPNNLVERFEKLELDSELVKPSNIISFSGLEKIILKESVKNPDSSYHEENLKFLISIREKIDKLKGENDVY